MPLGQGIRALTMMDDREMLKVWEEGRAQPAEAPSVTGCASPEEIFAAAHGRLDGSRVRALLDHVLDCAACSEALQIARSAGEDHFDERPGTRLWMGLGAAAAVAAAVAVIATLPFLRGGGAPQIGFPYRNPTAAPSISSSIEP